MSEREKDGKLLFRDTCVPVKIDETEFNVQDGAGRYGMSKKQSGPDGTRMMKIPIQNQDKPANSKGITRRNQKWDSLTWPGCQDM